MHVSSKKLITPFFFITILLVCVLVTIGWLTPHKTYAAPENSARLKQLFFENNGLLP